MRSPSNAVMTASDSIGTPSGLSSSRPPSKTFSISVPMPTMVAPADIRQVFLQAGFEAVETQAEAEDVERQARRREIARLRRLLTMGLCLTAPLFLLSMGRDLGLLPAVLDKGLIGFLGVGAQYFFPHLLGGVLDALAVAFVE